MSIVTLSSVSIAFGHFALLDNVDFRMDANERVALIGRNGEGKSTLLKIISGEQKSDQGKIEIASTYRIGRLVQDPVIEEDMSVFQFVASGLGQIGQLITDYLLLAERCGHDASPQALKQLEQIQHALEAQDGWRLEQRVATVLSRLSLHGDDKLSSLSGGWRRRAALAQILVTEPDVLLLDEPTNHLDIEAIEWLEAFLLEFKGALLFVSHDREFMQKIATRIVELDRGKLTSYPSNYAVYLETKAAQLQAEATQNAKFDKVLAQEEVWIRQGIKARRTRNEGRVRALYKLREERAQRREKVGNVQLNVETSEQSGKIVIAAEDIHQSFGEKTVIQGFSTTILRGDRIGLLGANGSGKTTLLKILLGELTPDRGKVTHGTRLQIVYFDQLRSQLDLELSVFDVVSEGQDFIVINGQRKHVMSYLGDFLFPAARARSPVKSLSGGERNRLLLAKLFTKPTNVLVLDEPTNDLDIETLELLEELLAEYTGTLLLVSHDRRFLDNVVTSTIAFEGNGVVREYVGGYQDWLRQISGQNTAKMAVKSGKNEGENTELALSKPIVQKSRKLSYKEQRELTELPRKIEELEQQLTELQTRMADGKFYRQDASSINQTTAQMKAVESALADLYQRWEELEQ